MNEKYIGRTSSATKLDYQHKNNFAWKLCDKSDFFCCVLEIAELQAICSNKPLFSKK